MKFTWQNKDKQNYGIKKFLNKKGISHRMYNDVKHDGSILVNDKKPPMDYQIAPGDSVTVVFPPEQSDENVGFSYKKLLVVYEDENWLVVNKPAGLTSVPGPSNREDTLVNRIKGYLNQQGSTDLKPHLITRLDCFTSGLVLVAKHRLANSLANQEVASHKIDKRYYAIVNGIMQENHRVVEMPIGRNGDNFRREVMPDGQNAKTEYWVDKQFADCACLKLKLHTGRTHQIRVHMTELQHPLLGDQLYEGPLDKGINRQALHAYYLKFWDALAQQNREFKLDLPEDMKKVIEEKDK